MAQNRVSAIQTLFSPDVRLRPGDGILNVSHLRDRESAIKAFAVPCQIPPAGFLKGTVRLG